MNSFWSFSGAICCQRSESILSQVMACCLMAPSHYLNQCWLITKERLMPFIWGQCLLKSQPSVTKISLKTRFLKFHSNLPGGNELKLYHGVYDILSYLATLEMMLCPVGTMNPNLNGEDVDTDCVPCTAGAYCLEGVASPNGLCETGCYCPTDLPNPYGLNPPLIGSYGPRQVCEGVILCEYWSHP